MLMQADTALIMTNRPAILASDRHALHVSKPFACTHPTRFTPSQQLHELA